MASFALKVVDEAKEQLGSVAASTKQAATDAKVQVDLVVAKVRGQTWSEPLGKACSVTGGIAKGLGNFVPGFGILGGALSLGSKLLNPMASRNDLERAKGEHERNTSGTGSGEVREDMEKVKAEVKVLIKEVQQFSQSVGQEIKDMKDVVNCTFDIVVDTRYKVV